MIAQECMRCMPGDQAEQVQRLAAVLTAFWQAHPDQRPLTEAGRITQANALYAQLYPTPRRPQ